MVIRIGLNQIKYYRTILIQHDHPDPFHTRLTFGQRIALFASFSNITSIFCYNTELFCIKPMSLNLTEAQIDLSLGLWFLLKHENEEVVLHDTIMRCLLALTGISCRVEYPDTKDALTQEPRNERLSVLSHSKNN